MPRKRSNIQKELIPSPEELQDLDYPKSAIMEYREYKRIYHQLNTYSDVEKLSNRTKFDRELLFVIYTQKTIREITKNYYRVVHKTPQMRKAWERGQTFVQLANEFQFSPVLIAGFVLRQNGYTNRMVKAAMHHPEEIKNRRIRREIREVLEADMIYSPEGNRIQRDRGQRGEQFIAEWLNRKGIEYKTEHDLRGVYPKTPDFLLEKNGFSIRGNPVRWIESKGSFGDKIEIFRNIDRQLSAYHELFGDGMVIYHFGFVSNTPLYDGILIETPELFKHWEG